MILVGINIAIYILGIAAFDEVIYDRGSLNAQSVLAKKELYRMVSCMFLHAGIDHLVGNMIFLAALGEMLEPKMRAFILWNFVYNFRYWQQYCFANLPDIDNAVLQFRRRKRCD